MSSWIKSSKKVRALRVGDPLSAVDIGPRISKLEVRSYIGSPVQQLSSTPLP